MFNIKIISILSIFVFLFVGCEDPTKPKESNSATKKNTLNDPNLGNETGDIQDYFFNFDEEIEARYLYYNLFLTRGANTISNVAQLDPYKDTLNFQTFPYYIADIENGNPADTVSYLLSLTPEDIQANSAMSAMFPLDETNTANQNWCNELLVKYAGDCPSTVEVDFDYQFSATGTGAIEEDTVKSKAIFSDLPAVKDTIFTTNWNNIEFLIWVDEFERYSVKTDSAITRSSAVTNEDDFFDSLIYIAIIDTSRFPVTDLMFVDRTEWDRYEIINKSENFPHILADTFRYKQVLLAPDAPMYRINGDCNQNQRRDLAEDYFDFGPDWCPDSLETGLDKCEVVDTDEPGEEGYGSVLDEVPCNCLGNWIVEDVIELNSDWVADNNVDPNGDNWRDCGWDGICPGDDGYESEDPNDTELNGIWDSNEGFEENGQYNFDILTGTGEYFNDLWNDISNEPAEFCASLTQDDYGNNVCAGDTPFEDRNCNDVWDGVEDGNEGNGIWDDDESYIDLNGNHSWDSDPPEPLYTLSEKLETYTVDYSDLENPRPVDTLAYGDIITLKFGAGLNSTYIEYTGILDSVDIVEAHGGSYQDIESKISIYTNKIVESPLPGVASDYSIVKTKWYQEHSETKEVVKAYDYHLFKIADDGTVNKLVHPEFFNYYGYYYTWEGLIFGFWEKALAEEEKYIYSVNGLLRDGEFYYHDTTLVTPVAQYRIQNQYEVEFDSNVTVPFKQVTDTLTSSGQTRCIAEDPDTLDVNAMVYPPYNCPPVDTVLTNTFKIIRTKTMTMIGSGVEFGYRNTIWVGRDIAAGEPLGIVKDQLEIRWGEPFWEEYGSDWRVMSRLELVSLKTSNSGSSLLRNIFKPSKRITTKQFENIDRFNYDPYIPSPTFGLHRLRMQNDE